MNPLPVFAEARVLVVGDVMLDRYWSGPTARISPEAPVPVVRIRDTEARPGGAANVALNLAALGVQVQLIGVVGQDEPARVLREGLAELGVAAQWVEAPQCPTITKLRVLSRHQQMIRLDFEEALQGDTFDRAALIAAYDAALPHCSVVLLSDYGKGTLVDVSTLVAHARAAGKPVLIDPKGQNYEPYRGATLLTPNVPELEAVAGACPDEAALVARGTGLMRKLDLQALLITRSEKGMTLLRNDQLPLHLPTQAREVFDVTGAGDTVIATLAAALAAGESLEQAVPLANLAAGIVVGKLGTATVSQAELEQALRGPNGPSGVVGESGLLDVVAQARARGQRIVMTNGCFDLLHVGHVRYLEAARALGDLLIVAVNDDDSVRRLKGATRPLNGLAERMQMLAALKSVDWVVAFSEDTPARLIEAVLPDLLVKGGDYRPEQIAGYDAVVGNGGQVRVLSFHEGYSTTGLIERARAR